jgi:hypothetical protein
MTYAFSFGKSCLYKIEMKYSAPAIWVEDLMQKSVSFRFKEA